MHPDSVGEYLKMLNEESELVFASHGPNEDAYRRNVGPDGKGGVMFVIPGIWDGMPPKLLELMRIRRKANITGVCPGCEACLSLHEGIMRHENWCATDDNIRMMWRAWTQKVGQYARGRRIQENPLEWS